MRKAWAAVHANLMKAANGMRAAIGVDEAILVVGLALVAGGCWMAWKPGALLVPGLTLVWIALPARKRFIDRPPSQPARRKP